MNKILFDNATNDSVSVGSTSTEILAKNVDRLFVLIINDSDETIYLAIGADAVLNKGIRLNANGGVFEINSQNLYVGVINGISESGNKNVTICHA